MTSYGRLQKMHWRWWAKKQTWQRFPESQARRLPLSDGPAEAAAEVDLMYPRQKIRGADAVHCERLIEARQIPPKKSLALEGHQTR